MQPNELIQALRQADDEQRREIKHLLTSQTRKTTRRGLMTAGAGVLSWLAIGQAAGQSDLPRSSCEWFGHVDANGYNLQNLNALQGTGLTNGKTLTNIAGSNLTIDADGNLNASGGSSAGALTDSGTDTDGGDNYVLPNAADNIDLQSAGAILNGDRSGFALLDVGEMAGVLGLTAANQSIPSNTETKVVFDTSVFDDNNVTVDTSNHRITVDTAGKYLLSSGVLWQPSASWATADRCQIKITVNGNDKSPVYQRKVGGEQQPAVTPPVYDELSVGDNVETLVYQDSGSSVEINSAANTTFLRVVRLG